MDTTSVEGILVFGFVLFFHLEQFKAFPRVAQTTNTDIFLAWTIHSIKPNYSDMFVKTKSAQPQPTGAF